VGRALGKAVGDTNGKLVIKRIYCLKE